MGEHERKNTLNQQHYETQTRELSEESQVIQERETSKSLQTIEGRYQALDDHLIRTHQFFRKLDADNHRKAFEDWLKYQPEAKNKGSYEDMISGNSMILLKAFDLYFYYMHKR